MIPATRRPDEEHVAKAFLPQVLTLDPIPAPENCLGAAGRCSVVSSDPFVHLEVT